MAFEQVRLFKISGFNSTTGAPTLETTPLPFLAKSASETEINNISITLQPETVEKTYAADNVEEKNTVIKGYNGSITFYGIDADALDLITTFTKDSNGNIALTVNKEDGEAQICVFYRGKLEKGKKYNMWLYDVEFKPIPLDNDQDGDSPASTTIEFFAKIITVNSEKMVGSMVYEGNTGYIEEGTEPTSSGLYIPSSTTTA